MTMNKTTSAEKLYRAGYTDLVSVIPPGARLSATSKMDADQLGKAPGRKNHLGSWGGYDWRKHETTLKDAVTWDVQGSNIGLRAANFPAVDIDTTDAELSAMIESRALEILGGAPKRTGRAPKCLLVYTTAVPFGRMRLWLTDKEGTAHLIEVLGDGQQYVVAGTHPSGATYTWDIPLHEMSHLVEISPDQVEAFFAVVAEDADFLGYTASREGNGTTSVDRELVEQEALRAPSLEAVEAAVAVIPNTNELFPGRDDYLRMGYAIKASIGEEGLPVFMDWATRWEGNDRASSNEPEEVESDWGRMVPPYEVGWNYISDTARRFGYNDAGDDFEALDIPMVPPDPENVVAGPLEARAEGLQHDMDLNAAPAAYSDRAVMNLFLNRMGGNLRFCDALGGWHVYNNGVWMRDETLQAEYLAGKICAAAGKMAAEDPNLDKQARVLAMKLCSNSAKNAVLAYAKSDRRVASTVDSWDKDPWALNTPVGVVDLRTGELGPHNPKALHSRMTAVAPAEGTPARWLKFLSEACGGDQELVHYLHKSVGYWLTGKTSEQILQFFWGPGGNGKSVFVGAMTGIMGNYAQTTPTETFASTKGEQHPTELAALRGARMVTASETQEGRYWDESKVKLATGGDPIRARFMHKDSFEFLPQFKLAFLGNHKPRIHNLDRAMKRRIHLVPFTVQPAVVDRTLPEKLKEEWPQILQWAIEGCRLWIAEGLEQPAVVKAATNEYFTDEDPIGRFIEERCVVKDGVTSMTTELFDAWRTWAHDQNEHPRTQRWLVNALLARGGIERWRCSKSGLRGLQGIELLYQPGEFEAQPAPAKQAA